MDNDQPTNINQAVKAAPDQATSSATVEPVKLGKTNKTLIIILSILLVISLAAGAVFTYLYFSSNTQTPTASNPTPETPISDETTKESENNTVSISLAQVEALLKNKYHFDTSTAVIFDGWHKYIENFDQSNKILFTVYQLQDENKFRSEQLPEDCGPIIRNISFEEFNDAYTYYFGNTEPLEKKDYQIGSLVTKIVYDSENDGFDVYFPNCLGGYSMVKMLSKVDNVTDTENGFKATILAVTLDSVARQNVEELLDKSGDGTNWFYEIPMSDETLEEIRGSLSAYEFNFANEAGEYKLVSINKI